MRPWAARACTVVLALAGAACDPGIRVDPVPLNDVRSMDPGAVLAPLKFERVSFNIRRGARVGSFRDGIDCAYSTGDGDGLWWNHGRLMSDDVEWSDLFFEQLSIAGYDVIGDPEDLFPGADRRRPAYTVRAAIEEVRMNLCQVVDVLTRAHLGIEYGKASMRVYWQVYSPILRKVVLEARTQGYHAIHQPIANAAPALMAEAFAQAAGNFAAEPALVQLVHQPRPTREELVRARLGQQRWLPYTPLFDKPFAENAATIRHSVVTLDTGVGHGSGFFIAPHLILTNHHVVEGTTIVRVRLVTGRQTIGDVVAYDEARDVALVQVEPAGYRPLPLRLAPLRIGEDIYAIGNPLTERLRGTVTKGVVSRFTQNDYGLPDIQGDVDIHGGNSGGPLLDTQGNVVGISYAGYRGEEANTSIGLNLFIPIASAVETLELRLRHPNDTRTTEEEE